MKKHFLLILSVIAVLAVNGQELTVGTYNIRNNNRGDYKIFDGWNQRKEAMCAEINFIYPDLFGCQEATHQQIVDMLALLPDYAYLGVGREDGKEEGEYSPVYYKKDRFKLLDSGTFWLAEDPTKPVMGWDAACKRVCTWGYFKDKKSKRKFYFFNTHMDHIGVIARREGAKLIMKKMRELMKTDEPVVLTGDFNVDQYNEIYAIFSESDLLKDCYAGARYRFAPNGSFNDFKTGQYTDRRIDHIFVSKSVDVQRYAILNDTDWRAGADGEKVRHVLSDHYPVFAKIVF